MNTTTNKVVYETSTEPCWLCFSWDHPFERVVTKKHLKPVMTVENVTRTTLGGFLVFNITNMIFIIIIDIFCPEHAPSEDLLRGVHQVWQRW